MSQPWHARVADYIDRLEKLVGRIDWLLQQSQVDTSAADAAGVDQSRHRLLEALQEMERMLGQRETLLRSPDAPRGGAGLTGKLRSTGRPDDESLAHRCERLGSQIGDANARAVSLFVCQFHLAELSTQIVRLIAGASSPSTYTAGDPSACRGQAEQPPAGGLFNESA